MRSIAFASLALAACAAADPQPPEAEPVVNSVRSEPVGEPARPLPRRTLQGPGELQVRAYLKDVISDRFGAAGWNAFNSAATAVVATSLPGRWATNHEPQVGLLLIRTTTGWRVHVGPERLGRKSPPSWTRFWRIAACGASPVAIRMSPAPIGGQTS